MIKNIIKELLQETQKNKEDVWVDLVKYRLNEVLQSYYHDVDMKYAKYEKLNDYKIKNVLKSI